MEENSQKPSAEEQNEPQNTPTSPNGATDSVEKQEPINTPAEVEIDLETKTAAEEAEEIKKKKLRLKSLRNLRKKPWITLPCPLSNSSVLIRN